MSNYYPSYSVWNSQSQLTPTAFLLWGAQSDDDPPNTWGIYQYDIVTDPSFLASTGTWGYVQTMRGHSTLQGNVTYDTGLDSAFPYPNAGWNDATSETGSYFFEDAPGRQTFSPENLGKYGYPLTYSSEKAYDLYIFYKPVDSSVGQSVFIPIVKIPWSALGHISSQNGATWNQEDDGSGWDEEEDYPQLPSW